MRTAFGAGHGRCPGGGGLARRVGALAASASKVHPVAVVAEHVEDPVGRQRRHNYHGAKPNAGGSRPYLPCAAIAWLGGPSAH
jgi:hypothetical protein